MVIEQHWTAYLKCWILQHRKISIFKKLNLKEKKATHEVREDW